MLEFLPLTVIHGCEFRKDLLHDASRVMGAHCTRDNLYEYLQVLDTLCDGGEQLFWDLRGLDFYDTGELLLMRAPLLTLAFSGRLPLESGAIVWQSTSTGPAATPLDEYASAHKQKHGKDLTTPGWRELHAHLCAAT